MTEERLERIIISVSPEITKSKRSNMRRNSTGKVGASASFSTPKDEAKVVPRYLRASTSSCHDYCKYGRNHTFEAKGKHPILSAFRGDKRASNEEKVGGSELGERKKKPVIKHNVYSDKKVVSVNRILSMASIVEAPIQGEGLNKVSHKQETVVSDNPVVPAFAEDRASQTEVRHQSYKSNSGEGKKKPIIKLKVSPDKKLGQFDKLKATKWTGQSSAGKIISSKKLVFPSPAKKHEPSSELSTSLKPKLSEVRLTPLSKQPPSKQSPGMTGKRSSEIKTVKDVGSSRIGGKKTAKPLTASVTPKISVNGDARLRTRKKDGNLKAAFPAPGPKNTKKSESLDDKISEKTLYIIDTKLENGSSESTREQELEKDQSSPPFPTSSSSPLSRSSSRYISSLHEEDQYESESSTISEASDSVGLQGGKDSKKSFRRGAMVHPEEADLAPHKLKFRSGKVIDLQCENNGPKRLKFRKGRSMGENANNKGDSGRRSFRRRKEVSSGGSKDLTLEAKTVVLKHQDVQEKKDMQGLLNHVIEETASKLVETRKSRVKALVGAFESVISLQESKAPLII
ncbi:hypothetical protein QJS04_geneDACA007948 [Acorus gramineus]|uniref:Calmodulin-binding domain-containing protein n=1 Tax=Acorus gramineus TaxID=55184 RepID=A0AAV9BBE1_ACOGR|nr:hypothetical protein QJS04_geneDACA007948 [Acorus gramineus]